MEESSMEDRPAVFLWKLSPGQRRPREYLLRVRQTKGRENLTLILEFLRDVAHIRVYLINVLKLENTEMLRNPYHR